MNFFKSCTKKWISPFEFAFLRRLQLPLIHISPTYRRPFDYLFLVSLCCLAFGLSCSNLLMSLAQFGFGIAVFAVPDYGTKFKRLLKNPVALAWIGFYVLFLIGGLGSTDLGHYLTDIRTKMPLWVMPAALALMPPLTRRQHSVVLHFFVAGCVVAMLAGWYNLAVGAVVDRRDLSPLLSHIRLGLYLVLTLFILLRFLLKRNAPLRFMPLWAYGVLFVLFTFWLFYLKSFTAVLFFGILFPPALVFLLVPKVQRRWRTGLWLLFGVALSGTLGYGAYCVNRFYHVNPVDFASLPERTALGNPYKHDTGITATENGNRIWIYLQFDEMRQTWATRSRLPFDSLDKKGNLLHATLVRYLASKNLTRDAQGINALDADDVANIENGIPNYLYAEPFNIKGRIYETLWELEIYAGSGDPNGKSMSARIELWRAAFAACLRSPFSGYGTGDVRWAIEESLQVRRSKLDYKRQFGPHNEYLAVWLALGIGGLLWFLSAAFLPLLRRGAGRPPLLFYVALALMLLSALNEDIFETQASVTFFAFAFHLMLNGNAPCAGKHDALPPLG